jgi:hypothetical protein
MAKTFIEVFMKTVDFAKTAIIHQTGENCEFFAENCFPPHRHCEERSDEAIQKSTTFWIASSLRSSQ